MPHKEDGPEEQGQALSAVDFINGFNGDIEGFEVDLSLQVEPTPDGNNIYAGISVQMGRSDAPAFIPSNVLRQLADEADAMAEKAIADANAHRGG